MMPPPASNHTIMTLAPTQADLSQPSEVEETSGLTSLEHYRPFFRELDLDVLKIFTVDTVNSFIPWFIKN